MDTKKITATDLKNIIGSRDNYHYGEWDLYKRIYVNGEYWGYIGGEDICAMTKNGPVYGKSVYVKHGEEFKEYEWYESPDLEHIVNEICEDFDTKEWSFLVF